MDQKTVCISGVSRGIGFELAKRFLRSNFKVIGISRADAEPGLSSHENYHHVKANIAEADGVGKVKNAVKEFGSLNILINNAATLLYKPFKEISRNELDHIYKVNVFAPFFLTQCLYELMENCHTINISSVGGVENSLKFPGLSAYSSSKAALNCLTQMWAEEFKDTDHTFNCLALGSVQTEMFNEAFPGVDASCTPNEMAEYIFYFAINSSKVQNGKIFSV